VGRFLRFAVFFVVLLVVFVLVGFPLLLGPFLTGVVRDAGLKSDTLSVTVAPFDPTLLFGKARRVTLIASGVQASPAAIGEINLSIGNASYFDRTFETVDGEIDDVTLTVNKNDQVHVGTISVNGPAEAANATAHLSATDTERLIRLAGTRAGLAIDDVRMSANGVMVEVGGVDSSARLTVSGGALVLEPGGGGSIVLLQPAASDPWKLQEAYVDADGLNVRAVVDMARITRNVTGSGSVSTPE
jgi:hypothetical protein